MSRGWLRVGGDTPALGLGGGQAPAGSLQPLPCSFAWARLVLAQRAVYHPPCRQRHEQVPHMPRLGRSTSPTHNLPTGEEKKCLLTSPHQTCVSRGTFMCPAMVHGQHSVPRRVPVSFTTQDTTVLILP